MIMSEKLIKHWVDSSERDFNDMHLMYHSEQYSWCLFVGHLVLEKLLKAIYAQTHTEQPVAPRIHNLIRLAELCDVELDIATKEKFNVINSFNLEARYEDVENDFYEQCTKEFADEQCEIIKELREWLITLIKE